MRTYRAFGTFGSEQVRIREEWIRQTSNALRVMLTGGSGEEFDRRAVKGGEPLIEDWAFGTAGTAGAT